MWDMDTKSLTVSVTTWGGRGRCGIQVTTLDKRGIIVAFINQVEKKERKTEGQVGHLLTYGA